MAIIATASSTAPPQAFSAVTPSDTVLLSGQQYLYIGVIGDVAIKGPNDTVATVFKAVPQGTYMPFGSGYVMATNTTATNIAASA